jgi:membrane protein DedA with SNARE-associated domain
MSNMPRAALWWGRQPTRRRVITGAGVGIAVVVFAAVVLNVLGGEDGFSLIDASEPARTYLGVFLLVFLDAVVPVFPGETTLNAAATAAAQGTLELGPVIAMGALGAILGDSTLFWIARRSTDRVGPQLEKARENEKVKQAFELMDSSAPVLIVGGRYVPGMRFVVNATMGLSDIPYRRFLPWSILGGVLWSAYTCLLAYKVATSLAGFPLASVVISGVVTTVALVVIFYVVRKRRRDAASRPEGASLA